MLLTFFALNTLLQQAILATTLDATEANDPYKTPLATCKELFQSDDVSATNIANSPQVNHATYQCLNFADGTIDPQIFNFVCPLTGNGGTYLRIWEDRAWCVPIIQRISKEITGGKRSCLYGPAILTKRPWNGYQAWLTRTDSITTAGAEDIEIRGKYDDKFKTGPVDSFEVDWPATADRCLGYVHVCVTPPSFSTSTGHRSATFLKRRKLTKRGSPSDGASAPDENGVSQRLHKPNHGSSSHPGHSSSTKDGSSKNHRAPKVKPDKYILNFALYNRELDHPEDAFLEHPGPAIDPDLSGELPEGLTSSKQHPAPGVSFASCVVVQSTSKPKHNKHNPALSGSLSPL